VQAWITGLSEGQRALDPGRGLGARAGGSHARCTPAAAPFCSTRVRLRADGVRTAGAAGCRHGVGWLGVARAAVVADLRLHMHRAGL
jgi:hypothetical protein